ncbi:MAG: hypothetical protein ABEI52_01810 [Halobacteriaceae archaeon]
MAAHSRNHHILRLSARLVVFGTWIGAIGMLIIYFATQMMSSLSNTVLEKTRAGETSVGMDNMVLGSMMVFYKGGLASVVVGGLLMGFGSIFITASLK